MEIELEFDQVSKIDVTTEVEIRIDFNGNAKIRDTKILHNKTNENIRLNGPFKQTIHRNASLDGITFKDAHDRDSDITFKAPKPHDPILAVSFAAREGIFEIPAQSRERFNIDYAVSGYAKKYKNNLLVSNSFGNAEFDSGGTFNTIQFHIVYYLEKKNFLDSLFYTYEAFFHGFSPEPIIKKSFGKFQATAHFNIADNESKHVSVLFSKVKNEWLFGLLTFFSGFVTELLVMFLYHKLFSK